MIQRYSIDRNAIAIERWATDEGSWLVFLALHYAVKYSRDSGNSNISVQLEICRKLIEQGSIETLILLKVLLYKMAENTNATKKEIKNLFGDSVAKEILEYSRQFENINVFKEFHRNTLTGGIKQVLTEERYSFSRDGVFLENFAIENCFWKTLVALHYANKSLLGILRRDGSNEIDHSTSIACRIFDRGIIHDIITATALLHDVPEVAKKDTESGKKLSDDEREIEKILFFLAEIKEIFGGRTAYNVDCLTKRPGLDLWKYFQRILENKDASIVKSVDKENIVSTMIKVFGIHRLQKQLREIENHILDFMKDSRDRHKVHKGLFFSCREHIKSMKGSIEKYIKVVLFVLGMFKRSAVLYKNFQLLKKLIDSLSADVEKTYGKFDLKDKLQDIVVKADTIQADVEEMKSLEEEFIKMTDGI